MQRLKELFSGEDRAVSPVIGVILMVAITVILAAVIASFVLGLGDSAAEPAPNPTLTSDHTADELELSVTGGDDFSASDASVNIDVTIQNSTEDDPITVDGTLSADIAGSDSVEFDDSSDLNLKNDDTATIEYDSSGIDGDEVTAGDSFSVTTSTTDDDAEIEIVEWEVDIIWNPADQDSDIIYSDSS